MAAIVRPALRESTTDWLQAIGVVITAGSAYAWLTVPDGVYAARFAAVLATAAWWMAMWGIGALQGILPKSRLFGAAVALAAAAVITSAVASSDPAALTWGMFSWVSAPIWLAWMIIMLGCASISFGRRVRDAMGLVAAAGALFALISLLRFAGVDSVHYPWLNSNYAGPAQLLLSSLALGVAATVRSGSAKAGWRVTAAIIWLAALVSGSSAALLGGVALISFLWILSPGSLGVPASKPGPVVRLLALVFAAGLLAGGSWAISGTNPIDRLNAQAEDRNTIVRIDFWRAGLHVVEEHPILGVGPDGFTLAGQPFFPRRMYLAAPTDSPQDAMPADPHSLPLLVLVNGGALGALAFGLLVIAWIVTFRSSLPRSGPAALFKWSLLGGLFGWSVSMLFLPLTLITGALPAMLAGLALVHPASGDEGAMLPVWKPAAAVTLGSICLYLAATAVIGWSTYTGVAGSATPAEYLSLTDRACAYQPTMRFYERAELWARAVSASPGQIEDVQNSVSRSDRVVAYAPYLVSILNASLDQAQGTGRTDLEWELEQARTAYRLAPEYPEAVSVLGRAELANGNTKRARELVRDNTDLEGIYPNYDALAEAVAAQP